MTDIFIMAVFSISPANGSDLLMKSPAMAGLLSYCNDTIPGALLHHNKNEFFYHKKRYYGNY